MRFAPFALPLAALLLAYGLDLPKALGAHPWWSRDILLYGGAPGIVLALAAHWARLNAVRTTLGLTVFGLAAFATATLGKARFAASYAEDALAGQAWFFGWIATALFLTAAVSGLGRWLALRTRVAQTT